MNILSIDCGTKTGFACLIDGKVESGVVEFVLKRGESVGMRFILFNAWLKRTFDLVNPYLVIYEMAHQRGGSATELLLGMTTRIQEECAKKGIQCTSIHSATLKKFATGSGKADKKAILYEAQKKFNPNVIDHNEADALFMLCWAKQQYA